MGFGLSFVGYFIATLMSINKVGSLFRIIGYGIVFISAGKLSRYDRSFKWLSLASAVMLAVSALIAAADVSRLLYEQTIVDKNYLEEMYVTVLGYIEMAVSFGLNASMLYAIRSIARETEVEKISFGAVRNFFFICIYYALCLVSFTPLEFAKYLGIPALIVYFVWIILNLALIASCYARICDENDVEMEIRPSRFAFVNKMRMISEERRKRTAERDAEYAKQNRKRRGG